MSRFRVLQSSTEEDRRWFFAADIRAGLARRPKRLPSRYFYDDEGSRLFEKIMRMPEYYPTRSETDIFERHGAAIVERFGDAPINLVDLGAGDGTKTEILLRAIQARGGDVRYVPVDISEGAMETLTSGIAERLPGVEVEGLVCEYVAALRWLRANSADGRRSVALFLGSNIGNFDPIATLQFLAKLRAALRRDDQMLIGFDLKKDIPIIERAYGDEGGVTAAFNLNLLRRINREFHADFNLEAFKHHGFFNPISGAAESYLISQVRQEVMIRDLDLTVAFDEFEPIHTEYSHKYLRSDIERYARESGFVIEKVFCDEREWFADALWRAI